MTNEEQVEEILYEASSVGLRNEVIDLAKKLLEDNKTIQIVDAYNLAYTTLIENKLNK